MKKITSLTLIALLAGCTVGPDYQKPAISLPQSWFSAGKTIPVTDEQAEVEQQWWTRFHDPVLDSIIAKASTENYDLKIAESRITEARAARASSRAAFMPQIDATASDLRQSNRVAFPGPFDLSKPFNTFQAGFDASWEPDLFGGKRRALESSSAELAAAEATRDDVRVSLLAEVARTYVDIRGYQRQLMITHETIATVQRTVGIIDENYRAGRAPQLDLMQAKAQLEQMQSQIPYYENLVAQSEFSMDVLLGQQPGTAHKLVQETKPIPSADSELLLAAPSKVIAERPDIRIAEHQLAAATAQQGVAAAQFFPDVSLSGFFGLLNVDAGNLLQGSSKSWSAGGNILAPILNFGRLSASLDASNARQQQALASYQKAVIGALSDVSRSVTAYTKQDELRMAIEKTVADNRKTADIARSRYREGLSSFIDVLDAERTLYASEGQLAQANVQTSQNLIAVYKSLGGGWKQTAHAPEKPAN